MTIFLVRHGETEQNAARVVQLPSASLSMTGRIQAQRLAERIAALGVARILASDLTRAAETANCVSARTAVPVELEPTLRERDFGDLRGTPYHELDIDPFAPEYVPPNGESWAVFHERVAIAWERVKITAAATAGNLLVVTHGLVCRVLVERHLSVAPGMSAPTQWANTSVTEIDRIAPWLVRRMNCVAHLETTADFGAAGTAI